MSMKVGELYALITADDRGFRKGVRNAHADLKRLEGDVNRRLSSVTKTFRKGGEDAGESFGARLLTRARPHLERLGRLFNDLKGRLLSLGKIAAAGGGLVTIGVAAAGSVGPVLQLASALGTVAAGGLALLPALAAGAAGALATLKLGTVGLGDAFKAIASGDGKKFEEALKNLSPNAANLARTVRDLHPEFDKLRRSVQDRMFAGLAGEVRQLARAWLPQLRTGLGGIAEGFNQIARNALQAARSSTFMQGIGAALDATRQALEAVSRAVGPVLEGLGAAAGAAAPFLAQLGRSLGDLGVRFGRWLTEFSKSGGLTALIMTAAGVLSDLGGIAREAFGILKSVMAAANTAGGGLLGNLREILGSVNQFLSSAQGQQALIGFFSATSDVVKALLPGILALAGAVGSSLGPALSGVALALAPVITMLGEELADALEVIAPTLPDLAASLAEVVEALLPIIPPLAELIALFLKGLAPALLLVAGYIRTITVPIINALIFVLSHSIRIVEILARVILTTLIGAFQGLVANARTIGRQIKTAVGNLYNLLPEAGKNVVRGLIAGIKSMFGALGDTVSSLVSTIRDRLPFSPAKLGPLSGRGAPIYSGRSIGRQLAAGIRAQAAEVADAMRQLTAGATAGAPGFGGAAGGGPALIPAGGGSPGTVINLMLSVSGVVGTDLERVGQTLARPVHRALLDLQGSNGTLGFVTG